MERYLSPSVPGSDSTGEERLKNEVGACEHVLVGHVKRGDRECCETCVCIELNKLHLYP